MVTRLRFVTCGHSGLTLPGPRIAGRLLGRLCSSYVVTGLCRYATLLGLPGLLGPRLTPSLSGGTLLSHEVSRIRIYTGR